MNWKKVDASLTAALSGPATHFNFSVRTQKKITQAQEQELRTLGCVGCFMGKKAITANGSAQLIDRLSNLNWVTAIENNGSTRSSRR